MTELRTFRAESPSFGPRVNQKALLQEMISDAGKNIGTANKRGPVAGSPGYTAAEHRVRALLIKRYGFNSHTADRWMGLERVKLNLGKAMGTTKGPMKARQQDLLKTVASQQWSLGYGFDQYNAGKRANSKPHADQYKSLIEDASVTADVILSDPNNRKYLKPVDVVRDDPKVFKDIMDLNAPFRPGGYD